MGTPPPSASVASAAAPSAATPSADAASGSDVISVIVGGVAHTASLEALRRPVRVPDGAGGVCSEHHFFSMLLAMEEPVDGAIYIPRDWRPFSIILLYLLGGGCTHDPADDGLALIGIDALTRGAQLVLAREADFYGLRHMRDAVLLREWRAGANPRTFAPVRIGRDSAFSQPYESVVRRTSDRSLFDVHIARYELVRDAGPAYAGDDPAARAANYWEVGVRLAPSSGRAASSGVGGANPMVEFGLVSRATQYDVRQGPFQTGLARFPLRLAAAVHAQRAPRLVGCSMVAPQSGIVARCTPLAGASADAPSMEARLCTENMLHVGVHADVPRRRVNFYANGRRLPFAFEDVEWGFAWAFAIAINDCMYAVVNPSPQRPTGGDDTCCDQ